MNITNGAPLKLEVDESGQALAEYSLIIAFIATACVVAATLLGIAISAGFGSILPGF